jgi:hypothetical protein
MLEDVLSPAARKVAYKVYKWLAFVVGLGSLAVATVNYDNAQVLLVVALGNAVVNYFGAAIGKAAEDNTHPEA